MKSQNPKIRYFPNYKNGYFCTIANEKKFNLGFCRKGMNKMCNIKSLELCFQQFHNSFSPSLLLWPTSSSSLFRTCWAFGLSWTSWIGARFAVRLFQIYLPIKHITKNRKANPITPIVIHCWYSVVIKIVPFFISFSLAKTNHCLISGRTSHWHVDHLLNSDDV